MSDISDLMDWFHARVEQEEKAWAARKAIAQEQRALRKTTPVRLKLPRARPVVLTTKEWRALLSSGKSRAEICRETGCSPRTVFNRADALGIKRPS